MKYWLIAALFAAACASAEQSESQNAQAQAGPTYTDARDVATDEQVRDARRAYRAACETRNTHAYCECMTGGMAQVLPPDDLAIATAAFLGQTVQASQEARDRVAARRSEVERGCDQFRG